MGIETFIKGEAKKYKNKAINNKKKGVNLDKLEKMLRQHENNCIEFIGKQKLSYANECKYKDMARNLLQDVDNSLFGCFDHNGKCVGYNYH